MTAPVSDMLPELAASVVAPVSALSLCGPTLCNLGSSSSRTSGAIICSTHLVYSGSSSVCSGGPPYTTPESSPQSLPVLSPEADARSLPSGGEATAQTQRGWPSSVDPTAP